MRVLGRGIAALIRDVDTDTVPPSSCLTSPELRARIREQLTPIFFDDTAALTRKLESVTHPIRNDLTQASFAHLRGGKLHSYDTQRMNSFRAHDTKGIT